MYQYASEDCDLLADLCLDDSIIMLSKDDAQAAQHMYLQKI